MARYWITRHRQGIWWFATVWTTSAVRTGVPEVVAEEMAFRSKTAVRKAKRTVSFLEKSDGALAENLRPTELRRELRRPRDGRDA